MLAVGSLHCATSPITPHDPRPNVLLVVTDDQSYPHASAYGTRWVKTPAFDRVARAGVRFDRAFVSAPSCAPSRASLLTGEAFYRLGSACVNHAAWPEGLLSVVDLLGESGYAAGSAGKGFGPGDWRGSGRSFSPTGPEAPGTGDVAERLRAFLDAKPSGAPFFFWIGFHEPHRPYEPGAGSADSPPPPPFLPDEPEVRRDLADYARAIESADARLVRVLDLLDSRGVLDATLVVVTSDNGMPFPGAKATLYDAGTRVPLAVRYGDRVSPGRAIDDFVSLTDLAPTILEAAGIEIPSRMTGRSLWPLLTANRSGLVDRTRDAVVMGLERHAPGVRPDGAGYPMRAIRTAEYLYIRNLASASSPSGDRPGITWPADDPVGGFGDVDGSPTKTLLFQRRDRWPALAGRVFDVRPDEELYRLSDDQDQLRNVAEHAELHGVRVELARRLDAFLLETRDPRALGRGAEFDAILKRFAPAPGSARR